MILDFQGNPLRRSIGFVRRYEPVFKAQSVIGGLYVLGVEVPLLEENDEEEDAARALRMRRAA